MGSGGSAIRPSMRIDGIGMADLRSPACRLTGSPELMMAYADWLAFPELRDRCGDDGQGALRALGLHRTLPGL
jgi:hypothetical protein